jgi:hypothetical protein
MVCKECSKLLQSIDRINHSGREEQRSEVHCTRSVAQLKSGSVLCSVCAALAHRLPHDANDGSEKVRFWDTRAGFDHTGTARYTNTVCCERLHSLSEFIANGAQVLKGQRDGVYRLAMRLDFLGNRRLDNAMMTSVDLQRVSYFLLVPVLRMRIS